MGIRFTCKAFDGEIPAFLLIPLRPVRHSFKQAVTRPFMTPLKPVTQQNIAHSWGVYAGHKRPKTPNSKLKHDILRGAYPG